MTWHDVQLATLQKMFSADGTTINKNDDGIKEYINAMPYAANEALQMLCTAGKYLRKSYQFTKEKGVQKYDLSEVAPDVFRTQPLEIYSLNGDGIPTQYRKAQLLAGKYLVMPESSEGTYELFYDAWPEEITLDTADDYILPLDAEVAVLVPLYMAAELYKDDDISISTTYRNEFEAAFERLTQRSSGTQSGGFYSVSGWC